MKIKTQKINGNLAINKIVLDKKTDADVVQSGKNVIVAIDVSGSMYNELPKIRQQLKNKIPNLIGLNDTISIIWFSGKNQAGVLKEGVKVQNLLDIQQLNDAIDRFLVPIGLTAFLPPVQLTETVIDNLSSNGNYFSFIFLSDGYNNDSAWGDVVDALGKLESKVANATFIEYGYYADSDSLTEMSEIMGGEKIFSKDFDSYQEDFDKIVARKGSTKRAVDISDIKSKMLYQFLYVFDNENQTINVFSSKGKNEILVPENTEEIFFLTKNPVSSEYDDLNATEILATAYVLAERLKYAHVEDILVMLGDVSLINQFSGAYGKQKLNELKDRLKEYTFDNSGLYKEGKVDNFVIDPKQYCFMDLIKDLQEGDCKFYPYHEAFNYNRIGTKKVTKVELSEETKQALAGAKTLKEVTAITSELSAPEFVYPDNAAEIGMSFNTLVWNQERANLSVQTRLDGKVKLPKNKFGLSEVDSFIYRNYTLVKDGVINVSEIPVKLDFGTFDKLKNRRLLTKLNEPKKYNLGSFDENEIYILDISTLPTINRSMAINQSAKALANLEFDLIRLQVNQKYLKYLKDEEEKKNLVEKTSLWSVEATEWLNSIGVTENGGFAPKVEAIKSEDFYVAPVLKVKIEKTSTIPKITDFLTKNASSKPLNIVETILKNRVEEVAETLKGDYSLEAIEKIIKSVDKLRREYLTDIAKIKFGIILSRSWFKEFASLADNELSLQFDEVDGELKVTFDYKEDQIKL
jgi:hypothetical protein